MMGQKTPPIANAALSQLSYRPSDVEKYSIRVTTEVEAIRDRRFARFGAWELATFVGTRVKTKRKETAVEPNGQPPPCQYTNSRFEARKL